MKEESVDARIARLREATEGIAPAAELATRISDEVLKPRQRTPFSAGFFVVTRRALPIALAMATLATWLAQSSQRRVDQLLVLQALEDRQ